MRYEDWTRYQLQEGQERTSKFGAAPQPLADRVAELRSAVDGLSGRIKQELLAELKVEIERLIEMEMSHADR
jgi:hypothetical protein